MKPLLEGKQVEVEFTSLETKTAAVRGVDFALYPGQIVGIVGESGCGKSALLKAITQLNPPHMTRTSGQILYRGDNLLSYSQKQMRQVRGRHIGMIFQDPMTSLNPTMTVGNQIMEGYLQHFPRATKKAARERTLDILQAVDIREPQELLTRYPYTLSGGMRQRAMIAIALACEPALLLADEPTTALDVTVQDQILALLRQIRDRSQTTILLITHDMGVVASLCDQVLVMYAGKIVESAPVNELFSSPQHPYTQKLLKAIPTIDAPKELPLLSIEGRPPTLTQPIRGCAFCKRCPSAMRICEEEQPPYFLRGVDHSSACFLHDPRRHP